MKLNSSKNMFMLIMILSTLNSMNSNNWLTIWMSMEINMFMFLPMISSKKMKDQPMKYFIIQSTSSSLILTSLLINSINQTSISQSTILLTSMMLKLGMSPLHSWVPTIMNKMSWNNCIIMMSLMKIPPMIMINQLLYFNMLMLPMMLSLIMGSLTGLKQTSLKKIMAYSSISNSSWMMSSFMIKKSTTLTFMTIYTMMNMMIMMEFKKNNMMFLNQINYKSIKKKMNINLSMLSISGLPPTIGFFNKWMILKEMMFMSMTMSIMMILTSTISMFFYMRISSMYLLNSSSNNKTFKNIKMSSFITMNFMGFTLMFLIKSI
uniref:NADH-ubiquinone oxidoreductase chain 2 n=1 Tax=Iolania perkinsi TaxID=2831208 RepID=A0A8K1MBX4_9HEMI|nr:NADH dehydrogenase subunit 2 [Iolania perkinsi]